MYAAFLTVHVLLCVALIGLVLIQHGKGADAGAAFGAGASGTVFGSQGSASFLSRVTTGLAIGFFATSLSLAMMAGTFQDNSSVMDSGGASEPAQQEASTAEGSGGETDGAAPPPPEASGSAGNASPSDQPPAPASSED